MHDSKHNDSFIKKLLIERVDYEHLDALDAAYLYRQIMKDLGIPKRFFENFYEEQEQQELQKSDIKR